MDDRFDVVCPYCGEQVEIYLEPDMRGTFVQDCEVCCNPWRVRVSGSGEDRFVEVARADGSEGAGAARRSSRYRPRRRLAFTTFIFATRPASAAFART